MIRVKNALKLSEIYKPIQTQISKVAEEVEKVWGDALKLVGKDSSKAPKAKGKLLRPAICLLSAGAIGQRDLDAYVSLSTSYELLHLASLTHDDVIDQAELRRGGQSLNTLWNNHTAVLIGDYLVARALELLEIYKSHDLIINSIQCVREMAEGELQFFGKTIECITYNDCLELARKKTGILFARSAFSSAFLKKSPLKETLFQFGEKTGIAFQLIDDLLDLTQSSDILGKPQYSDITEKKVTLPIFILWNRFNDDEKNYFLQIYGKPINEKDQSWLQHQIERNEIEKNVIQHAENLILTAIKHLNTLPEGIYKESLIHLCHFILEREN